MSEVVAMAGQAYMRQLQAHPLRTKAITSGVLAGCSDAVAQKISGVTRLQLRRLLLIALYGFAYAGPFGHFLHKVMDRVFKGKKGKETTAKKVLVEQLTASPWNNMMFMMYYGLVVEGRPFGQVKSKVKKDYASVQLTAWRVWHIILFVVGKTDALIHVFISGDMFWGYYMQFWPIVSWINYEYMPLQLRVLFHSFVASCWAVFLNLKAARSIANTKKA